MHIIALDKTVVQEGLLYVLVVHDSNVYDAKWTL
jgi:hypothetical protein